MRTALSAYGFDDIENAQDITAEQALAVIGLVILLYRRWSNSVTKICWPLIRETLAYLPSDYTETLDSDLLDELNARSAEFGGVGQFTLAEAVAAKEAGVNVLTGEPPDAAAIIEVPTATPEPEPTAEPVEETVATGVALPDEWVQAAAAQGVTITTTADLTPEFIGAHSHAGSGIAPIVDAGNGCWRCRPNSWPRFLEEYFATNWTNLNRWPCPENG